MADRLTGLQQDNLLTLLCFSDTGFQLVRDSVEPSLFTSQIYRDILVRVYDFIDQFKRPPKDHLPDLLEDVLQRGDSQAELYTQIIVAANEARETINEEYVLSQLGTFIRQQRMKVGIVEAHQLITDGDLDKAEVVLEAALKSRLQLFHPGLTLQEALKETQATRDTHDVVNLGIPELDKRRLGPARKELHLFIAAMKKGKCIDGDSLVLMPNGALKKIKDVCRDKNDHVLALNEKTGRLVRAKVIEHWDNGKKDCVRVTTALGRSIITTANHLYLTPSGWFPVEALRAGKSKIAVANDLSKLGTKIENRYRLRLLGYILSDGCLLDPNSVRFTQTEDSEIIADFLKCVQRGFGDKVSLAASGKDYYVVNAENVRGRHQQNRTLQWFKGLGLLHKGSSEKFIPSFVFLLRDDLIAEFLKALFSGDGSIYANRLDPLKPPRAIVEYACANRLLARQIHHLLARLGIFSRVKNFTGRFAGKKYPGYAVVGVGSGKGVRRFIHKIGFVGEKQRRAKCFLQTQPPERGPLPYLTAPFTDGAVFDTVRSIRRVGKRPTFDLTVANHHNFVAQDIITHNSWYLLHAAKRAMQQRLRVVYVTLEMSDKFVGQRLLQSLFAITKREGAVLYSKIERDSLGRLTGFDQKKLRKAMSFSDERTYKRVAEKLEEMGGRLNVFIKQFPTRALTLNGLRAYLDALERLERFTPDVLALDYADLMNVDPRNYRIELGLLYQGLRGLAVERNMALETASQSNRTSITARMVTDEHTAEDISKIATSDLVLTYSQTAAEKTLGLARVHVSNARTDEDKFTILITQSYPSGQFCLDSIRMVDSYWDQIKAAATNVDASAETPGSGSANDTISA